MTAFEPHPASSRADDAGVFGPSSGSGVETCLFDGGDTPTAASVVPAQGRDPREDTGNRNIQSDGFVFHGAAN